MIKISKEAAHKLHNEYGVKFGENGISKTATKHPSYFLCESEWNLRNLLKITSNDKAEKILKEIAERKKKYKTEYRYN